MSFDISHLLDQWEYQPGRICVRRFKGRDGRDKVQLRVDLGVLQMNIEGRPDGKRPYGHESLFHYFQQKLEQYREASGGQEEGFVLTGEDCGRLQQEALQYHHRYICLLELGDHARVVRDTNRNLEAFDFVERFADAAETSWSLQQFRPQLLMLQARARGAMALKATKFEEAAGFIEEGMEAIRGFLQSQGRSESIPQCSELQSLEAWLAEVHAQRPLSDREKLERDLREAVRREDYEKAAEVRDALRRMNAGQ